LSLRAATLFLPDGKGSPFLFAQWRAKAGLLPLQSQAQLVDGGLGTQYFRSLWKGSFPLKPALPMEQIANNDGTGTDSFWNAFT
jgi:hypothetical protein